MNTGRPHHSAWLMVFAGVVGGGTAVSLAVIALLIAWLVQPESTGYVNPSVAYGEALVSTLWAGAGLLFCACFGAVVGVLWQKRRG